jgi:hypothetical protein
LAVLGVTGQSDSNIGRIFRGPGVVLMMFDASVAAGAVASPSSSLAAGSDLGATSALSSSCADGRSRRRVTVIPESNAPSVPPLAWVLAIERYPHRAGGCGGAVVLCRPKRSACGCLRGSCPGDFPDNFYLEVLDRQHRRGRSLPASQGAWPPPGSNSMTLLLPCTHMRPSPTLIGRSLVALFKTTGTARRPAVVPTLPRSFPRRRAPRALPLRAHALRPRLREQPLCSGLLASDLGWAEPGRAVLSGPAGDDRAEPP